MCLERRDEIQNLLNEVENQRNVRILYGVESGSRAWGFASPDSDWDVRFLYTRPLDDYLRIDPPRDVIELPMKDDLDVNGWDIAKGLRLFRASNPAILEWLLSPIVYREVGEFAATLRSIAATQASPRRIAYHYTSMARTNFKNHIADKAEINLKKYLYVLRPILCALWVVEHQTPPPTSNQEMLDNLTLPEEIRAAYLDLITKKCAMSELGTSNPEPLFDTFYQTAETSLLQIIPSLPDPTMEVAPLNRLMLQILGVPNN